MPFNNSNQFPPFRGGLQVTTQNNQPLLGGNNGLPPFRQPFTIVSQPYFGNPFGMNNTRRDINTLLTTENIISRPISNRVIRPELLPLLGIPPFPFAGFHRGESGRTLNPGEYGPQDPAAVTIVPDQQIPIRANTMRQPGNTIVEEAVEELGTALVLYEDFIQLVSVNRRSSIDRARVEAAYNDYIRIAATQGLNKANTFLETLIPTP
jgi:hypothetical protein